MAAEPAAAESLNWLSSVWIPLAAAIVGGLLSSLGAVASIAWQAREQRQTRDRASVELFAHLLSEQARYLTKIGEYRAAFGGQFSFIEADRLQATFQTFDRNREWLVWLKDEALRARIADALSDNNMWVFLARNLASEQQQAANEIGSSEVDTAERKAAQGRHDVATNNLNTVFADLTRLRDNSRTLAESLAAERR